MALREILPSQLYTSDPSVYRPNRWVTLNPTHVLAIDPKYVPDHPKHVPITILACGQGASPDENTIRAWATLGKDVCTHGGKLLIVCNDGDQRSCTVASIIMSVVTQRSWSKVLEELHAKFLTQGGHNWWPYAHWNMAITRHWIAAVSPLMQPVSAAAVSIQPRAPSSPPSSLATNRYQAPKVHRRSQVE